MAAQHAAIHMDDIAGLGGTGAQPLDHLRVPARGHEADVLAVRLVGDVEPEFARERARLVLRHTAQGEAQEGELFGRRVEQEIALVALLVGRAMQLPAMRAGHVFHVMARCERGGAKPFGRFQKIAKLDVLIAGDARHRRLAREIAIGERPHHGLLELALIVEHVMGDIERGRHTARILDVLAGAAGALLGHGLAMVVELQGDADDVVSLPLQEASHHGRVDAARHGDDHPRLGRTPRKMQTVNHDCC